VSNPPGAMWGLGWGFDARKTFLKELSMPHIVGQCSLMSNSPWWDKIFVSNPHFSPMVGGGGGLVGQHIDRSISYSSLEELNWSLKEFGGEGV